MNLEKRDLLKKRNRSSQNEKTATAYTDDEKNTGGFLGGVAYLHEKMALSTLQSLEGIWDYAAGGIAKIFGADGWAERQMENDWVNYSHADEWYDPDKGWSIAGDVAGGIGSSAPTIGAAVLGGIATAYTGGAAAPVAIKAVAATLPSLVAGLGAAGNATKEAYRETGELGGKEFGYGALVGATEAAVEKVTGGIGVGTGRIVSQIAKQSAREVTETLVKSGAKNVLKTLGADFVSEAFEEGLAEILAPVYQRMTYNPDAENASMQEIGYAALVGGLSGVLMSGANVTVNTTRNLTAGNRLTSEGKAATVLEAARQIAEEETKRETGYESFAAVKNTYEQLSASLSETNGQVVTVKQKMLLGELLRENTSAVFSPFIERSAENILRNIDTIVERYAALGMRDANGNPVNFTKEQILSGIDLNADRKTYVKQLRKALSTNSVLATLAVADATGNLTMDTRRFAEMAMNGKNLASRADYHYFLEHAKDTEKAAVASALGIENFDAITVDDFRAAVEQFAADGRAEAFLKQSERVRAAAETGKESAKPLPHRLKRDLKNGLYRYVSEDGSVDLAVFKEGNADGIAEYRIYDYESGQISRALNVSEVDRILRNVRTGKKSQTSADTVAGTTENTETSGKRLALPENKKAVVVIEADSELARRIESSSKSKYTVIREYLVEKFHGQEFTLSDGVKAIMDKRDAQHLAHLADDVKTAELAKLEDLIERATFDHDAKQVVHQKFDYFRYYAAEVVFEGQRLGILLNVGRAKNDGKYHIYDITKNGRTADQASPGLSRPVGYAMRNSSSKHSIPQESQGSNTSSKKNSENFEISDLDTYANDQIKDYKRLSEPARAEIRALIRRGRALGVSEGDILAYAKISARTGVNVVFDKGRTLVGRSETTRQLVYADGFYDPKTNEIIVNPEGKRSAERLLIHEIAHAVYGVKGGKRLALMAVRGLSADEKAEITKRYAEVGVTDKVALADEYSAHYAEGLLGNADVLERLLEDEPSVKDRILGLLRGARGDTDALRSAAARRLFFKYKRLFDKFAAANTGRNAVEVVPVTRMNDGKTQDADGDKKTPRGEDPEVGSRAALPDEGTRTNDERIQDARFYQTANTNLEILSMVEKVESGDFRQNEKIHLGIVSDTTAEEIERLVGIDVHGFSVAVEARQIHHILKEHGKNGRSDKSMADPTDIAKIEYAFKNYKDISSSGKTQAYTNMVRGKNRPAETVLYEASIGEKSYYVVQAVPQTKARTLYIVTAFIGKEGYKKEVSQLINANSPDATAKSGSAYTSNRIISRNPDSVKSDEKNNSKNPSRRRNALPEDSSYADDLNALAREMASEGRPSDEELAAEREAARKYDEKMRRQDEKRNAREEVRRKRESDRLLGRAPLHSTAVEAALDDAAAGKYDAPLVSKSTAEEIVRQIPDIDFLSKKTRQKITEKVWNGMNRYAEDPKGWSGFVNGISRKITNTLLNDARQIRGDYSDAKKTVDLLRGWFGKVLIPKEVYAEIQQTLGKEDARKFLSRWGKRKNTLGSIGADDLVDQIVFRIDWLKDLDEWRVADALLMIDELYTETQGIVKEKYESPYRNLSDSEVADLHASIGGKIDTLAFRLAFNAIHTKKNDAAAVAISARKAEYERQRADAEIKNAEKRVAFEGQRAEYEAAKKVERVERQAEKKVERAEKRVEAAEKNAEKQVEFEKQRAEYRIAEAERRANAKVEKSKRQGPSNLKIRQGMSDLERYKLLKRRKLKLTAKADSKKLSEAQKKLQTTDEKMEYSKYGDRVRLFKKLGEEFSLYHGYRNRDVKLEFSFSREKMRESVSKQRANYVRFAKMLTCLDEVIENAIGIEVHNRNEEGYKEDGSLKNVYVLASAFVDGSEIIPVKLEIKEFSDKENTLHLAIALEGIEEDGIVKQEDTPKDVARQYSPPSTISIAEYFRKINPSDESFYKYIPQKFLENTTANVASVPPKPSAGISANTVANKRKHYEPNTKAKLFTSAVNARIEAVDELYGIEHYLRKVGGLSNAEVIVNSVRASASQAQTMVGTNQYNIFAKDPEYMGKGLQQIIKPVKLKGKAVYEKFNEYLFHYRNIDCMTLEERFGRKNMPIFGIGPRQGAGIPIGTSMDPVTAEMSLAYVREIERVHPEFKKIAEEVWAYFRNNSRMRVEAGLVSSEQEARMNEMYPHYVPAYRDTSYGGEGFTKNSGMIAVSSTLKREEGGFLDILDVFDAGAEQTKQLIKAGNINKMAREIYDAAVKSGDQEYVEIISTEEYTGEKMLAMGMDSVELRPKDHQIVFWLDGAKVKMNVASEIYKGFEGLNQPTIEFDSTLMKAANKVNSVFKKLVTSYSPAFIARNPIRDVQDAGLNSKHPVAFVKNFPRAYKEIAENSDLWRLYCAMGGFSSTVFDFQNGISETVGKRGFAAYKNLFSVDESVWKKLGIPAKYFLTTVENANVVVEQATRFAEFIASIEAGDSAQAALYNSAEVTTNFGRRGRITKKLNATLFPFLNPSIQGFDKIFRNVKDAFTGDHIARGIMQLLVKVIVVGMIPQIFNMLLLGDDEEYQDLREEDKENNYLIKVGDTFIKIPKGRVASVIAGATNRVSKIMKGEDPDLVGYLENVVSQITPVENLSRTILSPFSDVANNHTWYGTELEGREFENVAPKERYDEGTSSIAIAIGQVINYSPKKIHYLLDQYSGVIGDFVLPATTAKAEKDFLSGNFTLDPASSNKLSTQFYELYDEAQYAKTGGDETAIYQVKYLNKVKSAISEMYSQKSAIQSSNLSTAEKLQQTRVVQILINEAYKSAVTDYALFTRAIETANVEEIDIYADILESCESAESYMKTYQTLRYTEAIRRMYGAERALSEYDEQVYEKMQMLNGAGIDYDVLYEYYFATKSLESDVDRNGNTVSGSKRKKVIAAINTLGLSVPQRLLLIAMKGYSIQNGDIRGLSAEKAKNVLLKYILTLRGKTQEEKAEIAEACGFTVRNGRIVRSA